MNKHPSKMGVIFLLVVMVSVIAAWLNIQYISPSTLIALFDGEVVSNTSLILPTSANGVVKLDQAGSIQRSATAVGAAIMLEKPDGRVVSIQFPQHGKKLLDIRENIIHVTTEQYFCLLKTHVAYVDLTQPQIHEIKNDKQGRPDVNGQSRVSN